MRNYLKKKNPLTLNNNTVILDVFEVLGLGVTLAGGVDLRDLGVILPCFSLRTEPVDGLRLLGAEGVLSADGPLSVDDRLLPLPRSVDGNRPLCDILSGLKRLVFLSEPPDRCLDLAEA